MCYIETTMSGSERDLLKDFEIGSGDETSKGEDINEKKNETSEKRVRMVVEPSILEDGMSDRWAKAGTFVKESEKKEFDAASIRNTVVPDEYGTPVPLDDENKQSLTSRKERYGAKEESTRSLHTGVLFSKNDLDEYQKYNRSSKYRKKSILFGIAAFVAVALTSILAFVLGEKVAYSNKDRNVDTSANGIGSTEDWWQAVDEQKLPPDYDGSVTATSIPPAKRGKSPVALLGLAPVFDSYSFESDIPFIWMIPRTYSMQVRDTIGHCFKHKFSKRYEGDITDSVFSHQLYPVANSFNGYSPPKRGRMFAMFREPKIRTVDMWHSHKEEEGDISLEDYLEKHHDNNWMTRYLTNNFDKPLTMESLEMAKTVLREKCIIGLDSKKQESFQNFIHFFGWDNLSLSTQSCVHNVLNLPGYEDDVFYPPEFSHEEALLMQRNHMDEPLYDYIEELFEEQKRTLFKD